MNRRSSSSPRPRAAGDRSEAGARVGGELHAPRAVTIVFMGDSITFGQYVDPELRWTSLIGDALLRDYLATPVNLQLLNRGISGETTRQGLERFPADVQHHRPEIMTLQFGLNDCNCWVTDAGLPRVSEAAYRANLIEMIERARRFGARRIILATNHPTLRHKVLLSGESLEARRRRYNGHVRDVAALTGVDLCDVEDGFSHLDSGELEGMLLPYPDLLHLNVAGHRLYASCIRPQLERAVAEIVSS
jgi:acyl-CoA thioesterase-1